ncbi:MAG: AraC family transcriptional regulator [Variovorax sp.]|nr:MAG: AraC family transcriptional regulator [Variovorax sp.]
MDLKQALAPIDPLGEALHFLRMSGIFYCRSEFSAPWGLALPAMADSLMFHVVTSGQCWLEVEGAEPCLLQPGDFALVAHGEGHRLASDVGGEAAPLFDLPRELVSERYEILRHGGGGAGTQLVCGAVRFDHPAAHRLVKLLPGVIRIEARSPSEADWIGSTLRLMAAEARALQPGGETIVTRLADILVVQAIRSWMAQDPAAQTGWLGALQDRQIGRAITLIHRDCARPWTLASLASEVAMSRSAFAARFTALVGEPAMQYVGRWRMQLALTRLQETDAHLADLASCFGYQSEAAFSRSFKRYIGISPGAARRLRGAAAA